MGNYISCTLATSPYLITKSTAAKILLPGGTIRRLPNPLAATAADLMLDFPGHFLVNSASLHIGRRFAALSADELLEPGNSYVLFPMTRVNSVVAAADLAPLIVAAGKAAGRARILPDLPVPSPSPPRLKLHELADESVAELKNRMSLCRSRRPGLETISEESNYVCY